MRTRAIFLASALAHCAVARLALGDGSAADGALMTPAAIVAGGYVAPDGTIQHDGAILIADGRIKELIPSEKLTRIEGVVRFPDAVISPGLIDLRSVIGAYGKAKESAVAMDAGASAADTLDPRHPDYRRALEAGVTTVMIAPDPNNIVSGTAVVLKTSGHESGITLREDGPLMLALGPTTWDYDREPTSRIGALAMLREGLAEAKAGKGHKRLQEFVAGTLDGFVFCGEPMDVSAALRTLAGYPARFNLIHNSDEDELASEIAGAGVGIVLGPYDFGMPPRMLSFAGVLASGNVPVAFAANMPAGSGEALRRSAALAVRYGMDATKARQAMTSTPAAMAGVGDRVGAIKPGLDADLVVFSGDPLRLDSRVLEVYVKGVRIYQADGSFSKRGPL